MLRKQITSFVNTIFSCPGCKTQKSPMFFDALSGQMRSYAFNPETSPFQYFFAKFNEIGYQYKYSTIGAITINVFDMITPPERDELIKETQEKD